MYIYIYINEWWYNVGILVVNTEMLRYSDGIIGMYHLLTFMVTMIFPWKRQWWYKSFCVNHNDYDSILESYVKQIGCPKGCHETWLENPAFAADCPSQNFHV